MLKICGKCKKEYPIDNFNKDKNTKTGYSSYCKKCKSRSDKSYIEKNPHAREANKVRSKKWKNENPERYKQIVKKWKSENKDRVKELDKKSHLWNTYKLTINDFEKMYKSQDGKCAICKNSGKLWVDHDHDCCPETRGCEKCVRGLLCPSCNTLVGYIETRGHLIEDAIEYIKLYKDFE